MCIPKWWRGRPAAGESQVSDFRYQFRAQPEGAGLSPIEGRFASRAEGFFFFFSLEARELRSSTIFFLRFAGLSLL